MVYFRDSEVGATRSVEDAGLLGMAFWRRFEMTLDYSRRMLWLRPNHAFAAPDESDMSGLTLTRTDDGMWVAAIELDSPADDAGIQTGDRITQVQGADVANLTLEDVERTLRSADGAAVKLRVVRGGERTADFVIKLRRKI